MKVNYQTPPLKLLVIFTKSRVATWISYDVHDLTKAKTDVHLRVGRIVAPDPGQRGKLGHRLFRSRHLVGLEVSSNRATPGPPPGHLAGWPQRLATLDHVAEVATSVPGASRLVLVVTAV